MKKKTKDLKGRTICRTENHILKKQITSSKYKNQNGTDK